MTDGPTGFQVAPITEDDMGRVTDILKRAADAIVGMSQLKADVDMLQATVKGLQADTERLRTQNANLDEALAHVRAERDAARTDATMAYNRATEAEAARDSLRNQVNDLSFEKTSLETNLAKAISDRDDEGFRVMELEEELKTAKARIEQATKHVNDMISLLRPDEPKAAPSLAEMPTPPSDWGSPAKPLEGGPSVVETAQGFRPTLAADEAPKPHEPTRTYHGNTWAPGHIWDSVKGEYYTEV